MPNWKKVIVSGSNASLNSLIVNNGVTGSLLGTASYADNAGLLNNTSSGVFATTGSNIFKGSQTIHGNLFMSGSFPLVYNNDTTNNMLFGMFDGSNIYGPYYQLFGNQYSNISQRGGAEFVYDIRNNADANFHISSFNGSNWFQKFMVNDTGVQITGSLQVTGGITGSLYGTSSWAINALTASSAQNASDILIYVQNNSGAQIDKGKVVRISGAVGDNPQISLADWTNDSNSANTFGLVTENIANGGNGYVLTEGIFIGYDTSTPGWTAGQVLYLASSGSITGSAPQAPLHGVRLGQVLRVQLNNGSIYVRVDNGYELGELHDVIDSTTTGSYGDLLVKSGSVWHNSKQLTGSYGLTGSLTATSFTGSLYGTSSWAVQTLTASYADAFTVKNNAVISGSLTILQNLTVFGSASITYITQSTLNIATNLITVNTDTPGVRFGGLAVIDSGSMPQISGSWLFDSVQNRWLFVHQNSAGSAITSSIGIMGPETYNSLGNETQITLNRLTKGYSGTTGEHIGDSQISDNGTTVSIPGNLTVTGSITGLINSASYALSASYSVSSSYAVSASYALTASYTPSIAGTTNYISKFTSNSTIGDSQIYDDGTNVGIGITSPSGKFHTVGDVIQQTSLNISQQFWFNSRKSRGTVSAPLSVNVGDDAGGILFTGYDGTTWRTGAAISGQVQAVTAGTLSSNLRLYAGNGSASAGTLRMILRGDTGNVLINTTTDSGYKLSVSGSGNFTNGLTVTGSLYLSSSLYSAQGSTVGAGTTTVVSISTGSYRAGFFDYTVYNTGNARAGTVASAWNGSSVTYTDTSTTDIGATNSVTMSVALNGGNVELRTTAGTTWTVQSTYRLI